MPKISSICVFCASSTRIEDRFLDAAARFGRLCAEAGLTVVFGGGRIGSMGALADGALAAGGKVLGVIPGFLDDVEIAHRDTTELFITENMHQRKAKMSELADAFVVLPGGIGTLEETFEIMTWKQLGRIHEPIVVCNMDGFWTPLIELLDHMTALDFMRSEDRELISVVDNIDDILPTLIPSLSR